MEDTRNEKEIDFSVIIPAFNAEKFIIRTLDSVSNQTHSNFEIVVTNDGSLDNTETVIKKYIEAHPSLKIRLSSQSNKGIGSARNNGISRARGKYLAFLDADDRWYINKLESAYEILIKSPDVDVLYHDEVEIREGKGEKRSHYGAVSSPVYDDLLFNGNRLSTSATVVKRELAQKISGFSENPNFNSAEDYEFWLRLAKNNGKFYYFPMILGEYHRVANSVSLRAVYHGRNCFNVIEHHINLMMDTEGQNKRFLQKSLNNLKTQNLFNTGRASFLEKNYTQASEYYLKACKPHFFWWKPYAGLMQIFITMVINLFLSRER
jgi:glycosyltransferase involved in cell wall biosynthesis